MDETRSHWEKVYASKQPTEVSWYQPHLKLSSELIERSGVDQDSAIIDVGGGASTLVDDLLERGFRNITVVDISSHAIERAKERLRHRARIVEWRAEDILHATLPSARYRLWHDRAVFHFLTNAEDRHVYVRQLRHGLTPAGFVVISTFSPDGPKKCSGLDVCRYSPETLRAELGTGFEVVVSQTENHLTPANVPQSFIYCLISYHKE